MEKPLITFETKVWEGDWRIILNTGRLERMIESCDWEFAERVLYINNVKEKPRVLKAAQKYLDKGIITSILFVDDFAAQTLAHFGLDKESFKGGYYYSIQELTGILNCKTKYLLHLTGDAMADGNGKWIEDAINYMEKDRSILSAQPMGDPNDVLAQGNLISEDKLFYKNLGFSDQYYLINPDDFKKPIYKETHPASARYPKYGGELFEKRLDSYMRNHNKYRLTSKQATYHHKNFPGDPIRRVIFYFTGINLKK